MENAQFFRCPSVFLLVQHAVFEEAQRQAGGDAGEVLTLDAGDDEGADKVNAADPAVVGKDAKAAFLVAEDNEVLCDGDGLNIAIDRALQILQRVLPCVRKRFSQDCTPYS